MPDQLKEIGLDNGTETVRRWFNKEAAAKVARRIKPSLSHAQKLRRIDFVCDQVDETTGDYLDQFNVVHLDESWFFLLRAKEKIRMFPGEEILGAPRVQHESHLPKIMVIVAGYPYLHDASANKNVHVSNASIAVCVFASQKSNEVSPLREAQQAPAQQLDRNRFF